MPFSNHKFSSGNWTSRGAKNSAAFLSVALASAFTLSACSDSSADSTATASTAVAIADASWKTLPITTNPMPITRNPMSRISRWTETPQTHRG